jgi:hypothetical protein
VLLKSVLKWIRGIVFIIKLFLYGMAKMDLMMETTYNEEMKRVLFGESE